MRISESESFFPGDNLPYYLSIHMLWHGYYMRTYSYEILSPSSNKKHESCTSLMAPMIWPVDVVLRRFINEMHGKIRATIINNSRQRFSVIGIRQSSYLITCTFFAPGIVDLFCELSVLYFPQRVNRRGPPNIESLLSY